VSCYGNTGPGSEVEHFRVLGQPLRKRIHLAPIVESFSFDSVERGELVISGLDYFERLIAGLSFHSRTMIEPMTWDFKGVATNGVGSAFRAEARDLRVACLVEWSRISHLNLGTGIEIRYHMAYGKDLTDFLSSQVGEPNG
jgi:hypothetical protein